MKRIKLLLLTTLTLLFVVSCSKSGSETPVTPTGGSVDVSFDLDASDITMDATGPGRSFTPSYDAPGFTINAFRKNESNGKFEFVKAIPGSSLTYDAGSKKLTGKHTLLVGVYKFYITYGAGQSGLSTAGMSAGTEWNKTNLITCTYGNSGLSEELFLQKERQATDLTQYSFVLNSSSNPKVEEKLERVVSRVDVMFVNADKNSGVYTEKAYNDPSAPSRDILDNRTIQLKFSMSSLATKMSLLGVPSNSSPASKLVTLNYDSGTGLDKVTIGSGTENKVGSATYKTYDNIQKTDIISKAAHIFGTYFLPFETDTNPLTQKTTNVTLTVTGTGATPSDVISRDIVFTKVPLEQNKVTILKVYVLGDGSKTVFDTDVQFAVEVITDWLPSNVATAEIQ